MTEIPKEAIEAAAKVLEETLSTSAIVLAEAALKAAAPYMDAAMSHMRLLNDAERDRFAWWLEQEARDGELMAKNIETMANGEAAILQLAKKERAEAMAAKIIAAKLRSIESFSVGGQ